MPSLSDKDLVEYCGSIIGQKGKALNRKKTLWDRLEKVVTIYGTSFLLIATKSEFSSLENMVRFRNFMV
jgi:hypothetical protein